MPVHHLVEPPPEAPVAPEKALGFRREAGASRGAAAGMPLEEGEARGALQLSEVTPGRPIRHAHVLDGLLERTEPMDGFEELRAAFTELYSVAEDDPELEPRPGLEGAAHRANA